MPFRITLSNTDSPKNRLTKAVSDSISFDFSFKEPTSYLSPVILITTKLEISLIGFNYAKIKLDIPRFYYVTDIILVSYSTFEVHLREDVLATYASTISSPSQSFFIERTSNKNLYNINIKDTLRPKEYIQITKTSMATTELVQAPSMSSDGVMIMKNGFGTHYQNMISYAVIIAKSGTPIDFSGMKYGKVPDRNGTIRLIPQPSEYPSVYMYCCNYTTLIYLLEWCRTHSEEAKSIIGIANYPYEIPHGDMVPAIRIAGKDESTGADTFMSTYYPICIQPIVLADFLWHPEDISYCHGAEIGDVNFQLFVPYLGTITLDNSLLSYGDEIQVVYIPYYASNECLMMVSNVTKNVVLHSETISIGQEIPLTLSNAEAIRDTWTKIGIKTSISLVANALKIASGNPWATLSAVGSIAGTTSDIITTSLTTHYQSSLKVSSAISGFSQWNKCYLTITKPEYAIASGEGSNYVDRFGLPCENVFSLDPVKDKDTYYKTRTDRLKGQMTDPERSEIISYLNSGVIVPPPTETTQKETS